MLDSLAAYHLNKVQVCVLGVGVGQHEPVIWLRALNRFAGTALGRIKGQVVGVHVTKDLHPARKGAPVRNDDRIATRSQVHGNGTQPAIGGGGVDVKLPDGRFGVERNVEPEYLPVAVSLQVEYFPPYDTFPPNHPLLWRDHPRVVHIGLQLTCKTERRTFVEGEPLDVGSKVYI